MVSLGHVDHGLRQGSDSDAALVRALAERLGVPCRVATLTGVKSQVARLGLEAAAREARYLALGGLAAEACASVVATAHTRSDQAETLLLRLARGAGPGALAGVRASRPLNAGVTLVRPLLGVSRSATEAVCARLGLTLARDPHNTDPARARTRVRRLLPALAAELNPKLEQSLAAAAGLLAEEDELLHSLARQSLAQAALGGGLYEAAALGRLHPALQRRCVALIALEAGAHPERAHLAEVCRQLAAARSRWALDVPGGQAILEGGALRWASGTVRARSRTSQPAAGVARPLPTR